MLESTSASLTPKVVIVAGQPGAGKSALIEFSKLEFASQTAAVINGDEYRDFHPQSEDILLLDDKLFAERTDPDVREWTRRLFDSAIINRRNIIFEGTMRQRKPIMDTITRLKQSGYAVEILAIAVKKEFSELGIIERYEDQKRTRGGTGRWTPPSSHDEAYVNMPNTLARIEAALPVDRVRVLTRSLECLYDNKLDVTQEVRKPPAAKQAIMDERARPLSKDEQENIKTAWERLYVIQARRGAVGEEVQIVKKNLMEFNKIAEVNKDQGRGR